ncbi:efflux RND transporter periplasmic adaptor subunit [Thiothrix lacustris]|uniref:Efflux RND transporter periplasmic adaptor subunit n=1 Tax=Thiothrix lacustris TaxID=525917 RepID=A0ABY9MNQ7_9GAMM|nr:efflux RND transporter periplasmic adaptor subunit [Thiothrix lacustris]WML90289.1 efflux RND transporter periplasmic adaptor subunit [Thiothrix lacustris]
MKNHSSLASRFVQTLLLATSLTTLSAITHAEDAPPAATNAALAVTITNPSAADWNSGITASGTLSPWQEAIVASEIGGQRIAKLLVDIGDKVKQGQTLAILAPEAVQADVAQATARVTQAEASLDEAKTNAGRARTLKSSGALPAQQIDQYLTGEATAKANLAAQKAALQAQQIRLEQTRITAPDNGIVSSRSATLGAVVQTGTELFRLVRQNKIEWRAEVAGRDVASIQTGQSANLTLPTGESVSGIVRVVSPTLDANTRNATVYISLPSDSPAKAGMFAEGQILTGSSKAMGLPQSAVILRDGNRYVFEVNADNHVLQRLVKTGRQADGKVEILEGITPAARVVATGGAFLNDGDTVQIIDKAPETAPNNASNRDKPKP